jgi:hypothetical protein
MKKLILATLLAIAPYPAQAEPGFYNCYFNRVGERICQYDPGAVARQNYTWLPPYRPYGYGYGWGNGYGYGQQCLYQYRDKNNYWCVPMP